MSKIVEHAGLKFTFPESTHASWSNDNIIHGVIEQDTYGHEFAGVVIDIGANIGAFSCLAAKTAREVYAYEPSSLNYEYLVKNVALNGQTNVVAKQLGLGNGTGKLFTNTINCGSFSCFQHNDSHPIENTETVNLISLDEMLAPHELVDFLKLDCEGAEWVGLTSCTSLNKVKNIVMELHFYDESQQKENMIEFLKSQGFKVVEKPANVPTAVTIIASK